MYNKHEQGLQVELDPPGLQYSVPSNVASVRQQDASATVLRMAVVACAALLIIFLAATCFRKTKAHRLGTSNRRRLAWSQGGKGSSPEDNEDGGDFCQQAGRKNKKSTARKPLQGADDTEDNKGPKSKLLEGPAGAPTSKKGKNKKYTGGGSSSSVALRSRQVLSTLVACLQGSAGCVPSRQTQEEEDSRSRSSSAAAAEADAAMTAAVVTQEEDSSSDESAGSAEEFPFPKGKRKKKKKHTRQTGFSITAFDKLTLLARILSIEAASARQRLVQHPAVQPDLMWFLRTLRTATNEAIGEANAVAEEASGELTGEQTHQYVQGLKTAEAAVEEARKLIWPYDAAPAGSASGEQETQSFIPVVVEAAFALTKLSAAVKSYEKSRTQDALKQMLNVYQKGHEPYAKAEALLASLEGSVYTAARSLVSGLLQELSELGKTVPELVLESTTSAATGSQEALSSASRAQRAYEQQAKADAKARAKALIKKLKKLEKKAKSEAKSSAKGSSLEPQVRLSALLAKAGLLGTAARDLVATQLLEKKHVEKLESAYAKLVGAVNECVTKSN